MKILLSFSEFAQLVMDTRNTQLQAFAQGTWDNLIMQWVKFLTFCIKFGLTALPVSDITLAWYAQFLSYSFESHSSVVNYLSGVKTLHVLLHFGVQGFQGLLVKLTVQGLRRKNKHQPRQALAINPIILNHIHATLDLSRSEDCTFWTVCLVSFFLLLCKSNVVSDSLSLENVQNLLHRQDLQFFPHEVRVALRWSKTNQFGEHLTFSLPHIPQSCLCPVKALRDMIALVPGSTGLCFRRVSGLPYTYYQFHAKVRSALKQKGYLEHLYSSHSFRQGGCTFAFLCGVPAELIKLLGGWKSDCYLKYLEFPFEARAAVK